ncbi:MAG: hypothetical protein CSA96_07960 [Bacteroidetes bacterium]|nr:MAG: hypothetical protein CSA96_07960 [Bacteroidota bacterium]
MAKSVINRGFYVIALLHFIGVFTYSQDFEVAPVLVSFDANPGEVQTRIITVRNHGNIRQKFALNLSDYRVDENGTKESVPAGSMEASLANWLTVNPAFVDLNPNESAEVELIMTVPRTGFRTRWGMIHVEVAREQSAVDADKQMATGVIIVPRIVVLVKQSPRSNLNYSGSVSDLKEVTKAGQKFRSFQATITNTGDKILDAKVFLALANLKTAEEKQFNPTTVSIYPGQKRKVVLALQEEPSPGQYALAFLMDYGHRSTIEGAQMLLTIE